MEQNQGKSRLFGQLAMKADLITKPQLEECLRLQQLSPQTPIGQILKKRGYLTESQIRMILKAQSKRPMVHPTEKESTDINPQSPTMPLKKQSPSKQLHHAEVQPLVKKQSSVQLPGLSSKAPMQKRNIPAKERPAQISQTQPAQPQQVQKLHSSNQPTDELGIESSTALFQEIDFENPPIVANNSAEVDEDEMPTLPPDLSKIPVDLDSSETFGLAPVGAAIDLEGEEPVTQAAQDNASEVPQKERFPELEELEELETLGPSQGVIESEDSVISPAKEKEEESDLDSSFFDHLDSKAMMPSENPMLPELPELPTEPELELPPIPEPMEAQPRAKTAGPDEETLFHNALIPQQLPEIPNFIGIAEPQQQPEKQIRQEFSPSETKPITEDFGQRKARRTRRVQRIHDKTYGNEIVIVIVIAVLACAGLIWAWISESSPKPQPVVKPRPIGINGQSDPKTKIPNPEPVSKPKEDLETLYQQGIYCFRAGNIQEASLKFKTILQQEAYKDALLYQAECYLANNQTTLAQENANAMLQKKPHAWAYSIRGQCYEKQANYNEAYADYQKALELDPSLTQILCFLSRLHRKQNRFLEALTYAQKAIQQGNMDGNAELNAARTLIASYLAPLPLEEKITFLKSVIQIDSGLPIYFLWLAGCLVESQPNEALQYIQKYLQTVQNLFEMEDLFAKDLELYCYFSLQKYEELEKEARKTLNGIQKNISLGSLLALSICNLEKEAKQAKAPKDPKKPGKPYKKIALVYYSIFWKIFSAWKDLSRQRLPFWTEKMVQYVNTKLGAPTIPSTDIRYIKKVIQLELHLEPFVKHPFLAL